ncbi:glycosyltransferase family 4 protein [Gracilimonas mengyeensis]|uniref:Glycosyltransferase involved in cell wall bisynthesis n=1 Tax=Gracilimonas mengyeensis TaxID=1302730 RepID=A0A521FKH0_9BACT|nr:glycosyltransferase family 1 protein [Gracilimonas mengyeensis]SMO96707.1 Glycosyltransferase involved in cell wall bisynthesis [Gracilimonas mengyeensis]
MNIAITTHVNPAVSNGLGQYIRYLIKGLEEVDSPHAFYIIVNKDFESFLTVSHPNFKFIRVDIPHHPRKIMRPWYFFWQNALAGKLFQKYDIDVFHLPNPVPLYNTFDVPHVVTLHDLAEQHGQRHSGLHQKFRMWVNKLSAEKASDILTVSEFSKKEIITEMGIPEDKIRVTYPGLTIDPSSAISKKMNSQRPYLLHVGGSRRNKNVERLIAAYLSSSTREKMDLYFVGETVNLNKSQNELKKLRKKGVHFKGYVTEEELLGYYQQAYALVYPSLYEGFGLPVLEAMALGVPVITSNCTSLPEVAGDAALMVKPESIISIRKAIEKLGLDDGLKEQLIKKGKQQSRKFDWKTAAQKTILVYEQAAGYQ